jgi:pimeloyl-ACP methyl ester carboxylesterase
MAALHVERSGRGDPFLLLHGAAGSSDTYGWLPDLGRTVVRIDFRGHGRSDRAGSYLLGDYVEDALSVLREIGPAPVAGHSLGGVVAWTLAQRVPELVTAIVLEDPPLYMGEPAEHARNPAIPHFGRLREAALRWQEEGTPVEKAAAVLAAGDPDRRMAEDAHAARAFALLHLDLGVIDAIADGTALAATDVAAPVRAPALILAASLLPAFPPEHEERLARTHPAVVVRRVPDAAHVIHDHRAHREEYVRTLVERL